jgi:hypothetical protein
MTLQIVIAAKNNIIATLFLKKKEQLYKITPDEGQG